METILNYNDFKEQLIKDIEVQLPHYTINTSQIYKNNVMKDVIVGRYNDNDVVPTIYIDDYYNDYTDNDKSYNDLLQEIISVITSCEDMQNKITVDGNKYKDVVSKLKDLEYNVLPRVVCTKTNTDMLKNLVHREFLDMSMYYVVQTKVNDGVGSIRITNDMLKSLKQDVTEEQLYKWSIANLKKNGINIKLRDISTERLKVDEKTSFALEHYGIHNYQELGIYIGNNTLMIADNMFLLNAFKVTASLVLENNKKNIKNR